jgi:hypothetical protein
MDRRAFGFGLAAAVGLATLGVAPLALASERRIIEALSEALFPPAPGMPSAAEVDVVSAVGRYLAHAPATARWQARGLLRFVDAATLPTHAARFHTLDLAARDAVISGWGASDLVAQRLIVHALRQMLAMGYYQHDATWAHLGYDGPLVGR